ncbi:AAA family ATPase [Sphingomonas sp. MMS12-HWE2-04]|uniref:AAA family ATPase n=1 Tax=Sphingomonas sp. MMS12-HWE2-04 TaxID=3234199 RepID=UPI00384B710C
MNDHTPRRFKGTLLERAAAQFDYAPLPPMDEAPKRAPRPVPPAEPAPEPVIAPEPMIEPVAQPAPEAPIEIDTPIVLEAPEPIEAAFGPIAEPMPVVEPEPVWARTGRRRAPIDRDRLAEGGMIVPGAHIDALAEEFRMVKRQLLLTARAVAAEGTAKAADKARMILVCSAQPDEGKTFCAINLALSMAAEKDVEILLVDADFAKPDVLERLGVPQGRGLLDALAGTVGDVEDCIVDTDIPQLSVLPAGTKSNSDTELLASDRARAILDRLAAANPRRMVIFDSPPALAASLASVLASHVGQVVLVVRADRTSEGELREAVATLDACEHVQLVLNSVSFQPGGRRFGSYYGESGR